MQKKHRTFSPFLPLPKSLPRGGRNLTSVTLCKLRATLWLKSLKKICIKGSKNLKRKYFPYFCLFKHFYNAEQLTDL
jgi:hypothetical protein